jgi:hypothetical protein
VVRRGHEDSEEAGETTNECGEIDHVVAARIEWRKGDDQLDLYSENICVK